MAAQIAPNRCWVCLAARPKAIGYGFEPNSYMSNFSFFAFVDFFLFS